MGIKQVIGGVLMIVLSFFLVILIFGTSIIINIKPSSIIKSMDKVEFIDNAEINAKEVLKNYLPQEKVQELLKKVSISSQIQEIVLGLDNNTIEKIADEKREEIKNQIITILDENLNQNSKEVFAETVSGSYIKAILPVAELSVISKLNVAYSGKILLGLVSISIISLFITAFLYNGKKTFKWAIIALYNCIILDIIALFSLNTFNGIKIGNDNTTAVILQLFKQVKINIIIGTVIVFVVACVFNYKAYFKKRKKNR